MTRVLKTLKIQEMGILSTVIGGGLSLGQALVNRGTQLRSQSMQNKANMQMAEMEFNRNKEMWKEMNKYNTPVEQMKRFKEAGLNPSLIYGQGTAGNASQLPKYNAPQIAKNYTPIDLTNVIGTYQDMQIKQAQIDNLKAEKRNKDASAIIQEAKAKYAEEMARYARDIGFNKSWDAEFTRAFNEEEFKRFFRYSAPDNKYYLKDNMEETYITYLSGKWAMKALQAENLQQDIYHKQAGTALRQKELDFLNSGGKYFNPVINLLRLLKDSR